MPERAGSRTPQAPRSGGAGEPILPNADDDWRAHARSLRSAKSGEPRILGPARCGMAQWKFRREGP
jgi:hypothetical protein